MEEARRVERRQLRTPFFTGSEPATALAGKYKGTTLLRHEQQRALAFVNSLDVEQRAKAILSFSKTGNDVLTEAWKDNFVLRLRRGSRDGSDRGYRLHPD